MISGIWTGSSRLRTVLARIQAKQTDVDISAEIQPAHRDQQVSEDRSASSEPQARDESMLRLNLNPIAALPRHQKLFLRRLTVISFGAAIIGERVSGNGFVAAIGLQTGVPLAEVDVAVFIIAGLLCIAAFQPSLWPKTDKKGFAAIRAIALESTEYVIDSLLCLAFAASLIVEALTGNVSSS